MSKLFPDWKYESRAVTSRACAEILQVDCLKQNFEIVVIAGGTFRCTKRLYLLICMVAVDFRCKRFLGKSQEYQGDVSVGYVR